MNDEWMRIAHDIHDRSNDSGNDDVDFDVVGHELGYNYSRSKKDNYNDNNDDGGSFDDNDDDDVGSEKVDMEMKVKAF